MPIEAVVSGRLYASLPTDSATGWSGHVNASFYPRTDRKGVLFENDFRSQWNRAAIAAAAVSVGESLERIREALGFAAVWRLLGALERVARECAAGTFDDCFGEFFELAKAEANASEIMLTADGQMVSSAGCRLPMQYPHWRGCS